MDLSLCIGATGSHVPYKSLVELRAVYMPDTARADFRFSRADPGARVTTRFRHRVIRFRHFIDGSLARDALREASRLLGISLTDIVLQESTPSEYQRVFAEIVQDRPDAIIVSGISELFPYRQLIVALVENSRLPAMYPFRDYAEAGGLMAYGTDLSSQ